MLRAIKTLITVFDISNLMLIDLIVLGSIGSGSKTTADIRHAIHVDGEAQWESIDRLKAYELVNGDFECSAYLNLEITTKGKVVLASICDRAPSS